MVTMAVSAGVHEALTWLEHNVRRRMEGGLLDRAVFSPANEVYKAMRCQS